MTVVWKEGERKCKLGDGNEERIERGSGVGSFRLAGKETDL